MTQQAAARFTADRRNFLKGASITGLSLASGAVAAVKFATPQQTVSAAAYSDTDILNFALNLEYLEAEFYAVSTYGATLVSLGIIKESDQTGPTTGGNRISNFSSSPLAVLATALRDDEFNHVTLLRSTLGSAAAKKPAIDLNARGTGFSSVNSWLALARVFEEVGMSAYQGSAPLLSSSTNLATAGAILATEGQHEGALRLACVQNGVSSPAVDAEDIAPTPQTLMAVNSKGLSIPRTPNQVLNVIYGGGRCSGGFFPNGLNGTIVCQS